MFRRRDLGLRSAVIAASPPQKIKSVREPLRTKTKLGAVLRTAWILLYQRMPQNLQAQFADLHGIITGLRPRDLIEKWSQEARYVPLTNRFRRATQLSDVEAAYLHAAECSERRTHQAGSAMVLEGEAYPEPRYIVSGWACRLRLLPGGRRQILGLLLPGDGVGLDAEVCPLCPVTIIALTTVETVSATPLLAKVKLAQRYPAIWSGLLVARIYEGILADNQIVRLGAETDAERLAHLLIELRWRLRQIGLGDDRLFPLPLTHETLSEVLGLSLKRVRRAIHRLRVLKAFGVRRGWAKVLSPNQLRTFQFFEPPVLWSIQQPVEKDGGANAPAGAPAAQVANESASDRRNGFRCISSGGADN